MVICNNKTEFMDKFKNFIIKDNKVVFKLFDEENNFVSSVIIPTVKYPVNNDTIHVFSQCNTKILEDENIIKLFDLANFKLGYCYHNAEGLYHLLKNNGINEVKLYTGWVFPGNINPVHHSWVVYKDKHILDLSNNEYQLKMYLKDNNVEDNVNSVRLAMVDFIKECRNVKNSVRCYPVGLTVESVYVGCEVSSADEGINIYNHLIKLFPDHDNNTNLDKKGLNPLFQMLDKQNML